METRFGYKYAGISIGRSFGTLKRKTKAEGQHPPDKGMEVFVLAEIYRLRKDMRSTQTSA